MKRRARGSAACRVLAAVALFANPVAARAEATPSALRVAFDGGVMRRTIAWNDDLFGMLRPFTLGAAPILGGELELFPGAFVTADRPRWLGVVARGEGIVGVTTQRAGHTDALPTHAWGFTAAVRGRLSLSHGTLWLDAGAAGRGFSVGSAPTTAADFPSVAYLGPRLAAGGEVALPVGFTVGLDAGLARWVSTGDLSTAAWFPHARAWGADLRLRLAWTSPPGVGPYLDFAWSRDLAALRPQMGEPNIAGGLADDRFIVRLGVAWTLRPAKHPAEAPP